MMRNQAGTSTHGLLDKLTKLGFADHPLADEMQWQRHHLFMKEVGPRMAATLVAAVIVGFLFIQSASITTLATWFGMNLFVGLNSWLILRRYHKNNDEQGALSQLSQPKQQKSIKRWHLANLYLSLLWGFQWAALPLLFLGDASIVQIFSILLLVTITSTMPSMTMGLYPDVYVVFLTPVLGAFGWHLWGMDLGNVWLHKFMAPAVWLSLVGFSYAMFKTQIDNLATRLELQHSKREIEQANQAKTRFLAAASHDIRQPLQAASLYWSAIKPDAVSEDQRPLFERLGASLKSTNELLNHLLDVSRLDAGVADIQPTAFDLAQLLEELRVVFTPLAQRKQLQLEIHCDPATLVRCDRTMTIQIFKNLLANAVQYTHEGSIKVSVSRRDQQVKVMVRDTGIGIASDQQQAIFEEFVQLDNPGRKRQKGLGLGLSIVSRLCRLNQLTLVVESEPGQGSCFAVGLPAANNNELDSRSLVDSPAGAATQSASAGSSHSVKQESLNGLKVMIIDDHEDILDSLSMLLVNRDCDVWVADGLDSLNEQLKHPACTPDIVISDDMLGDDGRVEAVLACFQQHQQSPDFIIATGDTNPERLQQLTQLGYPILHKPLEPQQLLERLQQQRRVTLQG